MGEPVDEEGFWYSCMASGVEIVLKARDPYEAAQKFAKDMKFKAIELSLITHTTKGQFTYRLSAEDIVSVRALRLGGQP